MDEPKGFSCFRDTGKKPFMGRIKGDHFFVYKKSGYCANSFNYTGSFNPTCSGIITNTDFGCTIHARFGIHSYMRVFAIVWFSMIVFFLLIGLLLLFSGYLTNSIGPAAFLAVLVPLGMMVFGILMMYIGNKLGKREEQRLREFFLELFNDVRQ